MLWLWALPMILAFVPGFQSYASEGFRILREDVPDWWAEAWGTIAAGVYGFNKLANMAIAHSMRKGAATNRAMPPITTTNLTLEDRA